jgi:hypothetical protein
MVFIGVVLSCQGHAPQIGGLAAIASGVKRHVSLQDGGGIIQDTMTG